MIIIVLMGLTALILAPFLLFRAVVSLMPDDWRWPGPSL